jgi:hypothetical protein
MLQPTYPAGICVFRVHPEEIRWCTGHRSHRDGRTVPVEIGKHGKQPLTKKTSTSREQQMLAMQLPAQAQEASDTLNVIGNEGRPKAYPHTLSLQPGVTQ